jgi:2-succinyl-6-hydroxy-2,4-cyclohexadiene-1-carboxylate synthase
MRLFYEVHDGVGPHLLLVHGMLSSRNQWMRNLEALQEVCRPVVVELWGHARSPSPEDTDHYLPEGYLKQFEAIREEVGTEKWFICGQSFGAGLTMRYALEHPDRILGQIFTNSRSALADAETVATYRENASKRAKLLVDHGRDGLEKIPVHPVHAKRMDEDIKEALLADAALHDPDGFAKTFEHSSPNLSVRDRAGETEVPTLLVVGEREEAFRPSREFAEATINNLQVAAAPGGHAVNIQSAEIFNQSVIDFIRKHSK